MDIHQTLATLDGLFAAKQLNDVEPFLLAQLAQAQQEGDKAARLALLNELVGYYRSISRSEDSLKMAALAMGLVAEMGLAGTPACATTIVNAATAYRAAGDLSHAAMLYEDALQILEKNGEQGYTLASLLNNMSQVYQAQGRHAEAVSFYERALVLLAPLPGVDAEIATTHSNLALSLIALQRLDEAAREIEKALALFERGPEPRDAHYGAALAAAGQLSYLRGDHRQAAQYFEAALPEIERSFGKNDSWHTTARNLEQARKML